MIGAIVLAAGESRRMGRQKLLLPYGGLTVIEHIIKQVVGSKINTTVVVTGFEPHRIQDALGGKKVTFAQNDHFHLGMLSSIRTGLAALPADIEAFMVVLGDQPSISAKLINVLLEAFEESNCGIIVPYVNDDSGHPILISRTYRQEIMTQFDDTGLRGLIYGRPDEVHRFPVEDAGVLRDIDTPEDYERELRELDSK